MTLTINNTTIDSKAKSEDFFISGKEYSELQKEYIFLKSQRDLLFFELLDLDLNIDENYNKWLQLCDLNHQIKIYEIKNGVSPNV